jgi:hypothetical protein
MPRCQDTDFKFNVGLDAGRETSCCILQWNVLLEYIIWEGAIATKFVLLVDWTLLAG